MQEKGKWEVVEAQPVYTLNCQNLSVLLGKEAARCHTLACACHHLPRALAVLDHPNIANKRGKESGEG